MQKNVDAGMIVFWSVAVLLLLLVILRQYLRLREHFPARLYPYQADGHYGPGIHERLFLFSNDPHVQILLTDLNRLLDVNNRRTDWR
ncbi:hypothetical protein A3844_14835 [Paenibacillus helianthi]|uniref:Uncharacterized protein n=1 Tax=Paenibacillus helianthi TaxID=1349432 RepID=A0ABX3EQQ3_9BACL|nr:hypothetical protein [Paenibacillus helianthi]OKP86026.1 hypothetical protein A3844_14835 [Paenibacillus helianthi]